MSVSTDRLQAWLVGNTTDEEAAQIETLLAQSPELREQLEHVTVERDPLLLALRMAIPAAQYADEPELSAGLKRAGDLSGDKSGSDLSLNTSIQRWGDTCDVAPPGGGAVTKPGTETIRDYRLIELLGKGGMGAVYRAVHTRLDKVVAIKLLPQGSGSNEQSRARFDREMRAIGRLHHPNIVTAFDGGECDGVQFLVMELIDGMDVAELARIRGRIGIADACEIIRQAAMGLQHIHEYGLVHRDIKPSNLILVRPKGHSPTVVKLLDLGLALLSHGPDDLTQAGRFLGTLPYMAPEQANDPHGVDIRADLYSLGCTLYLLLAGSPPFPTARYATPASLIMAHASATPAPLRQVRTEIPPDLDAIVARMLAKTPAERFATPESLAKALEPFCRGSQLAALFVKGPGADSDDAPETLDTPEPGDDSPREPALESTPAPEPVRPQPEPKRRSLTPLIAGLVGLLLAAVAGGAYLMTRPPVVPDRAELVIRSPESDLQILVREAGGAPRAIKVNAGESVVPVKTGDASVALGQGLQPRFELRNATATLKPGDRHVVEIVRRQAQADANQVARVTPVEPITDPGTSSPGTTDPAEKTEPTTTTDPHGKTEPDKTEPMPDPADIRAKEELAKRKARFEEALVVARNQIRDRAFEEARKTLAALQAEEFAALLKERQADFDELFRYIERTVVNSKVDMELVLVPAGEFQMGAADGESAAQPDERPQHVVKIAKPFLMGRYEVTKAQFAKFVSATKYRTESEKGNGGRGFNAATGRIEGRKPEFTWESPGFTPYADDHPVVNVSWNDAAVFCNWLSQTEGLSLAYTIDVGEATPTNGNGYRLPTEAEWEYACRAGTTTAYFTGDDPEKLTAAANVPDAAATSQFGTWATIAASDGVIFTAPVGRFAGNAFDLHDLHGNVWEWCQDTYDEEAYEKIASGRRLSRGTQRTLRGGSFGFDPAQCRSANRMKATPDHRDLDLGFRVVKPQK
jgi:formylglycine-generating enzyme required for sulfatase activity/serine/threonine protein kinase